MILSPNQKNALEQLIPTARLATQINTSHLPISIRTHTLLCGPSGVGKSHLMRSLGEQLGIPVLFLNAGNWIPLGARNAEPSWEQIVEFLKENLRGIIILDEIDKINSETSDWMNCVRTEVFDLLDGRIPPTICIDGSNDLW